MSRTLSIVDGDIGIEESSGMPGLVSGPEKGSQDVAAALLLEFTSFFYEGNELLNAALGSTPSGISDTIATTLLTEAVNRLIVKQVQSDSDSRIVRVLQIRTRVVGMTTLVFLVEVLYANGTTGNIVNKADLRPTSLRQINSPEAFLKI